MFQGPNGEELLISSTFVEGQGAPDESEKLREQLVQNGLQAAEAAALQEGLVPVRPFGPESGLTDLPCWTFLSQTPERDVSFMGAVVATRTGVLLATFQAPSGPENEGVFRAFVASLRTPSED